MKFELFKSYLLLAVRSLKKNFLYSFVNIFGLSVSLSITVVLLSIINNQFYYDSFNKEAKQIFRINSAVKTSDNGQILYATSPLNLKQTLKEESIVKDAVTVRNLNFVAVTASVNDLFIRSAITSSNFFNFFNFDLLPGGNISDFQQPNTVVLTAKAAAKLFNDEDPVDKIIQLKHYGGLRVVGVIKTPKYDTHLPFEMYVSEQTSKSLEQNKVIDTIAHQWNSYHYCYNYVKVDCSEAVLKNQLSAVSSRVNKLAKFTNGEKGFQFETQRLDKITPVKSVFLESSNGLSLQAILILSVLALTLIGLASFNFINLTLARYVTRTKEVGLRKIFGASRPQIIHQFIIESILTAFLALVISFCLIPLIPMNATLQRLFSAVTVNVSLLVLVFVFTGLLGILSGIIPAAILSKSHIVDSLKNAIFRSKGSTFFKRALVIFQFTVSIVFMILFFVFSKQARFLGNSDYGFETKDLLATSIASEHIMVAKNALSNMPEVRSTAAISDNFGFEPHEGYSVQLDKDDPPLSMSAFFIDNNVIPSFKLTLLAGRNLGTGPDSIEKNDIIINELTAKLFKKTPQQILGKKIWIDDSTQNTVVGVVRDFHFQSMRYPITPMCFKRNDSKLTTLNVFCTNSSQAAALRVLSIVKKEIPNTLTQITFFEQSFKERQGHKEDVEMIGFVSILFLSVGCLGLLGMASYSMEMRQKEASIRKLLGASTGRIFFIFSKQFLTELGLATALALPISIIAGTIYLRGFAYHTSIDILTLISAVLIILVFGFLSFSWQAFKLSSNSIAKSLKSI